MAGVLHFKFKYMSSHWLRAGKLIRKSREVTTEDLDFILKINLQGNKNQLIESTL